MIKQCEGYYAKRGDLILYVGGTIGPTDCFLSLGQGKENKKSPSFEVYYSAFNKNIFEECIDSWDSWDSTEGNWVVA